MWIDTADVLIAVVNARAAVEVEATYVPVPHTLVGHRSLDDAVATAASVLSRLGLRYGEQIQAGCDQIARIAVETQVADAPGGR